MKVLNSLLAFDCDAFEPPARNTAVSCITVFSSKYSRLYLRLHDNA